LIRLRTIELSTAGEGEAERRSPEVDADGPLAARFARNIPAARAFNSPQGDREHAMPVGRRCISSALAMVVVAALAFAWTGAAFAADSARRTRRARWTSPLKPGAEAPDLRLPRLLIEKHDDDRWTGRVAGNGETVRLSSVWGKRPVCLFLSSYT
jgi:hypothetical protein